MHNVDDSRDVRSVTDIAVVWDGAVPVAVDAGFEVAPGDADDIAVCNQHTWGSYHLVFADGSLCATAYTLMRSPEETGTLRTVHIVFFFFLRCHNYCRLCSQLV